MQKKKQATVFWELVDICARTHMGIEPLDLCPYEPCTGPQTHFGCSKAAGLSRHRSATEAKLYFSDLARIKNTHFSQRLFFREQHI